MPGANATYNCIANGFKTDARKTRSRLRTTATSVARVASARCRLCTTHLFCRSWDWTTKDGIVSPIQNQASCGSCWAFSAVAALESAWAVKHASLHKLSEQVRAFHRLPERV